MGPTALCSSGPPRGPRGRLGRRTYPPPLRPAPAARSGGWAKPRRTKTCGAATTREGTGAERPRVSMRKEALGIVLIAVVPVEVVVGEGVVVPEVVAERSFQEF